MKKWSEFDNRWMFSLFGTAVGAGILFLPIRAGTGGFWPIVLMCVLIFPMTYLSHLFLSYFVGSTKGGDITDAVNKYFGKEVGIVITFLYFFAIYPICLAYGVGITNTISSFMVNQLGLAEPNRLILAIVLITIMMAVMFTNETLVTKVCEWLVYPLCLILFLFSLYLIPHWKLEVLGEVPSAKEFISTIWLTLPVLVFSFNHSPAISTFSLNTYNEYKENSDAKRKQILFNNATLLLVFVMFFVFSCILCLNKNEFAIARDANIPILSYFANKFDGNIISYGAPAVAFLAILTSFFGHYFGAREGLNGLIKKVSGKAVSKNNAFTTIFMYVTMIIVAFYNPSILGFIEDLGGPIIAVILFLMPVYAIYKIPELRVYKNGAACYFVAIMGIITITSVIYKMNL
ncbi:HAAAP family serine/threonine permease [Campylobacter sp. RM12654]|uniref:aromatic amino acid transport family protein n=1 Tax=Campylobacter sp. RM12654 TaxID=2735738 RepID=UPI00301497FF|nr:HAAAP family serine/threonine permease [Campylobacter sp. RM12654]